MDVVSIASTTVAALTPYFVKGAEAIASELGKKSLGRIEGLLGALLGHWRDKLGPKETLAVFAKDPAQGREALTLALVAELASDPRFAASLQELLSEDTPKVNVEQTASNVQHVTGAELKQAIRGLVNIKQEVHGTGTVVGVKIERLG